MPKKIGGRIVRGYYPPEKPVRPKPPPKPPPAPPLEVGNRVTVHVRLARRAARKQVILVLSGKIVKASRTSVTIRRQSGVNMKASLGDILLVETPKRKRKRR